MPVNNPVKSSGWGPHASLSVPQLVMPLVTITGDNVTRYIKIFRNDHGTPEISANVAKICTSGHRDFSATVSIPHEVWAPTSNNVFTRSIPHQQHRILHLKKTGIFHYSPGTQKEKPHAMQYACWKTLLHLLTKDTLKHTTHNQRNNINKCYILPNITKR